MQANTILIKSNICLDQSCLMKWLKLSEFCKLHFLFYVLFYWFIFIGENELVM